MIEYYTFKHRGDALDFTDEVFLRLVPNLTVALFYGSKLKVAPKSQALLFSEILNSEEGSKSIEYLSSVFDECLDEESEYLILRVMKNGVECYRRGSVFAKIVKDGQIHVLPNGIFGLNKGDGIVCATSNFYKYLTNEGILADALVSGTCNDWMNLMVRRISDQCQLKCGNLSAVTLMLND
ncbi:hypothetical protein B0O40_0564 [Ruminococcaceae bacterium R-25]|nr:hypothetical protein B0O40_0564 [Ruminococcaceae bacterium R-25]SUQ11194.1 hypothetical protein SAMN06297423_0564 [Oscillospiraceae bacterium]